MAAADRLSALPDHLLKRILSFAPAKEAAASSVLSRRWRPLWRRTGVLNLDSRHYSAQDRYASFDVFFRDATAALAASLRRRRGGRRRSRRHGTTLKKLTLFLTEGAYRILQRWYSYKNGEPEDDVRVAGLLADPAVAGLEELRIGSESQNHLDEMYSPPLGSLPWAATLRVLELERCNLEPPPPPPSARPAFPCLTDLTLRHCFALEGNLQAMVDNAPALTSLALTNLSQQTPVSKKPYYMMYSFGLRLSLRCPTVTALMLETHAGWQELEEPTRAGIELDMPSLRTFRYNGLPVKLSLTSPAPALERVDLDATRRQQQRVLRYEPTARMLTSFSSTRALKLHLDCIEDILAGEAEQGGAILPTFPNLKLLELDGKQKHRDRNTAVAVARLLASCPAMSELRLRLDMHYGYWYENRDQAGGPFGEYMDRFERLASMSSAHRDAVQLDGVSELWGALTNSNCTFSCLETSLRKVTLQFKAREVNCFQVRLAKFLVENAMVLQEMHVDDGSQFWPDHLCHKVARWRAAAFQARNLPDMAGFRVYQLASPVIDPKEHSGYD